MLALLPLWLLSCTSPAEETAANGVIERAAVSLRGDKLTARVRLSDAYLRKALEILHQGEPLMGIYRFRFLRTHGWLPERELADITVRRRLRYKLITERFEMTDPDSGETQYTTDTQEALRFLGDPRYIPLPLGWPQEGERTYRLEVRFHLVQEGVSRPFRLLNRWLTFWRRVDHAYTVEYRQS